MKRGRKVSIPDGYVFDFQSLNSSAPGPKDCLVLRLNKWDMARLMKEFASAMETDLRSNGDFWYMRCVVFGKMEAQEDV